MHGTNTCNTFLSFICLMAFTLAFAVLPCRGAAAAEAAAPAASIGKEPVVEADKYSRPTEEQKLATCLDLWEPATHMTKHEWNVVCKRLGTTE